jgi:hypothetical protein
MRTEIEFRRPRGYVDGNGALHQTGTMRLATARDEIEPLREVEVRQNSAYLTVLLLARTVTRLGTITDVTPALVESLGVVSCPECSHRFEVDLTDIEDGRLGE